MHIQPSDLRRGVSEDRRNRTTRRSNKVQQRRVLMAQGMPTDSFQSERFASRGKLTIGKIATAERRSCAGMEDESLRVQSFWPKASKDLDSPWTQWDHAFARARLGLVEMTFINRLSNPQNSIYEINVAPA